MLTHHTPYNVGGVVEPGALGKVTSDQPLPFQCAPVLPPATKQLFADAHDNEYGNTGAGLDEIVQVGGLGNPYA